MDSHSSTVAFPQSSPVASQPTDESSENPILIGNCKHRRMQIKPLLSTIPGSAPARNNLKLVIPFNIPPTFEASVDRIITNLNLYKVYYMIFVWSILFIALVPQRKVSLIFLVGMTNITSLYLILLHWFPNSTILHLTIDKRIVLFFLLIGTMSGMIITRAAAHFFLTLVGATPVILVHALLRVRFSFFVDEESCVAGGLVPIVYFVPFVHDKNGDYELPTTV